MNKSLAFYCFILSFSLFNPYVNSAELVDHTASYKAKIKKGISIEGTAIRSLKKLDNGKWLYTFNVDSFAADIRESSLVTVSNNTIIPLAYHYKLSPFWGRDKKRQVNFDWKNKTAKNPLKKTKWLIPDIPENTKDRLSYQLQLLSDINEGKTDILYQVAHKGKLRESHFQVMSEETIQTALGPMKSVLVTKLRDANKKRKTHLWFSKDTPMLLLKMHQTEKDGEEYEINIISAEVDGKVISFK
jgi:hypothetical protein